MSMDDEQHLVDAVDGISQTSEDQTKLRKRKVNVRRAHRASATKSVNQIEDAIESHDRHRLKLLKQSLTDKLATLAKLDDDIMELTGEDDLETEVEQADEIRDKISLAILKIEDALAPHDPTVPSHRRRKESTRGDEHHRQVSFNLPDSSEDEENIPPSTEPVTTSAPPLSPTVTRSTTSSSTTITTTSPLWSYSVEPLVPDTCTPLALPSSGLLPHTSPQSRTLNPQFGSEPLLSMGLSTSCSLFPPAIGGATAHSSMFSLYTVSSGPFSQPFTVRGVFDSSTPDSSTRPHPIQLLRHSCS